ncbi:lyase family protein [Blastococcus sp. Marseille-P5729]|uniref:lyase family protein n=1 Tax=Blastococcus sp. Marseille-P5729 TaxID=2086582 RepID=UPI00131E8C3D|nr:lyase family protein [Blastococcus sp. Marseille-P5729]
MSYNDEQVQAGWDVRPYGGVLDYLPGDPEVDGALNDASFFTHIATFEASVARAQGNHDVIPAASADVIADAVARLKPDLARIGLLAEASATPVVEIVAQIRAAVGEPHARYVHRGLTSQDCIDTAFSGMQARALEIVGPRLALVIGRLSRVAEAHVGTPMVARTLGQAASPITYGWKVCGWIEGLEQAALNLGRIRDLLAVQVGGAAGDIAGLGANPHQLIGEIADAMELQPPRMPWHTERSRVLQAASGCVQVINACAKIAVDVISMTSTEVGELMLGRDPRQARRGGSSAMPHKRNPAAAILIRSASTQAAGMLSTIAASGVQEHERAAGAWQAEWRPLRELAHLMGGVSLELALLEQDLDVDAERMAENLRRAGVGEDTSAAQQRCREYLQRFKD